jgi:DNA polymerase-3 subunit epsilon
MTYEPNYDADRAAAVAWAQEMLSRDNAIILDTETTGLDDDSEIVQLSIIGIEGEVILDTLIKPLDDIPAAATAIHGIDTRRVQHAPYFETVWPVVVEVIEGKTLVIYNSAYDLKIMRQCCKRALVPFSLADMGVDTHCAMHWYSQWIGDWNDYHGNYKWQRLPGGDHSALGDCRATLAVLKEMAGEKA